MATFIFQSHVEISMAAFSYVHHITIFLIYQEVIGRLLGEIIEAEKHQRKFHYQTKRKEICNWCRSKSLKALFASLEGKGGEGLEKKEW